MAARRAEVSIFFRYLFVMCLFFLDLRFPVCRILLRRRQRLIRLVRRVLRLRLARRILSPAPKLRRDLVPRLQGDPKLLLLLRPRCEGF